MAWPIAVPVTVLMVIIVLIMLGIGIIICNEFEVWKKRVRHLLYNLYITYLVTVQNLMKENQTNTG